LGIFLIFGLFGLLGLFGLFGLLKKLDLRGLRTIFGKNRVVVVEYLNAMTARAPM